MIVTVFNNAEDESERYSFSSGEVTIGRSPSADQTIVVDCQTISRNHMVVRVGAEGLEVMDLNSSNGSYKGAEALEGRQWTHIEEGEKVRLAEFDGYVSFQLREEEVKRPRMNILRKESSSDDESGSERSRSREKRPKRELPFKISESTLKMLKDMTVNRKTKQERVKFLKLMGISKAEEYWPEIESLLLRKKSTSAEAKKASDDLQRQFGQSRAGFEKKGLGRL